MKDRTVTDISELTGYSKGHVRNVKNGRTRSRVVSLLLAAHRNGGRGGVDKVLRDAVEPSNGKIALVPDFDGETNEVIVASLPFVQRKGYLAHRPVSVRRYKSHTAVSLLCGDTRFAGDARDNVKFVASPDGEICPRCQAEAKRRGLIS